MSSIVNTTILAFDDLEHAMARFRVAYLAALRPLRLTPSEAAVLLVLGDAKAPPSLNTVAKYLAAETPPSRLMSQLTENGLVSTERDPDDKRIWRFFLSAKGKKALQDVRRVRRELARQVSSKTNPSQLKSARKVLEAFTWS